MKKFAWIMGLMMVFHSSVALADPGEVITSLMNVPLPAELEFCGERVPLDREDVAERLEIELMVILSNPVSTSLWFKRKERYFPIIEERIRKRGLPLDLRYVPVVESNLRAEAISSAQAVGPWQFMYGTGKAYGLKRTSWRDDRRNWEKASNAGLRHLKDLYDDFDSWPLALAAYNAGKRRVTGNMEKQGEKDFYGMTLPRETERYVFRIMAAKLVLENPGDYGIDMTVARLYPPEQAVAVELKVTRANFPLSAIAEASGVSYRTIKGLNAWIRQETLPKGTYTVKIPAAAKDTFTARLAGWEAKHPEPKYSYHRVRRGDTLSSIAQKYGVQLRDLMSWNSLGSTTIIYPGQRLTVRRSN
jgi:membrane-bound lytic murein transglycosylase D